MKKLVLLLTFALFFLPNYEVQGSKLEKETSKVKLAFPDCVGRANRIEAAFCGSVGCDDNLWFAVVNECFGNGFLF